MKNPVIKYVMKDKKEDIFHSSAYGKVQNAESIGVASTESFNERMKVEQNRQMVQSYGDSGIMNGAYMSGPKAKKYVPPEKKRQMKGAGAINPAPKSAMTSEVKKTFAPSIKPKFGV